MVRDRPWADVQLYRRSAGWSVPRATRSRTSRSRRDSNPTSRGPGLGATPTVAQDRGRAVCVLASAEPLEDNERTAGFDSSKCGVGRQTTTRPRQSGAGRLVRQLPRVERRGRLSQQAC